MSLEKAKNYVSSTSKEACVYYKQRSLSIPVSRIYFINPRQALVILCSNFIWFNWFKSETNSINAPVQCIAALFIQSTSLTLLVCNHCLTQVIFYFRRNSNRLIKYSISKNYTELFCLISCNICLELSAHLNALSKCSKCY